jgi:hypothetical protein
MLMTRQTSLTPVPVTEVHAEAAFDGPMVNVAGFDPVDLLPAAAQEKVFLLRRRANEAHRLIPEFTVLQDLNLTKITAERRLKRMIDPPHSGGFNLAQTDARVEAATKAVEKATTDAWRQSTLREIRSTQWQMTLSALRNVDSLLQTRPGNTTFETVEVEPPKLLKNETVLDGIERLRRRGRSLSADLHSVRSAPFSSAHARAKMREMIEVLAMRSAPNISGLVENGDLKIDQLFSKQLARADVRNAGPKAAGCAAYFELVDPVGLIAWLFKDQLIGALDREITTESDDAAALDGPERARREAEILSDILANDRDLAALVWIGQAQGFPVEFGDISALAILSVRLTAARHASNGHASSLMHSFEVVGR